MNKLYLILLFLSSCASYTCTEYPTGRCQSVSKTFEKTKNQNFEKNISDVSLIKNSDNESLENLNKKPLLKKSKVLRVLLNTWEDEDKDLNVGGYIYVKVRDEEWEIY